jgi:hypothetical protein
MDSEGLLDSFEMDCGEYASVQEALGNNENLVFALNCDDKKGTLIENPYDAQGGVPTVLGEYTFFENGDIYGIYIDGMECQVDTIDNLRQSGIIITQYTKDWNEVTSIRN